MKCFISLFVVFLRITNHILSDLKLHKVCVVWSRCSEQTGSATHPERGSVLVFLPGLAEIQYMKEALAKLVRKRYVCVWCLNKRACV